jgi:long-chain acyl-CoA synthetase
MHTLIDLLQTYTHLSHREALVWTDDIRTRRFTYAEAYRAIAAFAAFLDRSAIVKGDRLAIWGENRPEWVFAFWGALARGVHIVPVDYRFSPDLCERICTESAASALVHGNSVKTDWAGIPRIGFDDILQLPAASKLEINPGVGPDDIVEIVFTSGTTATPKGVVHRHRNIVANLKPFEEEIRKYQRWARPFQPIRLLNLLPLSHMFGQALGLYIPLLLGGSIVFMEDLNAGTIIDTTRRQKVSVIVSVPRIAQNLANEVQRKFVLAPEPATHGVTGVLLRWWRYRRVHSRFGWKFWSLVVGGAQMDPSLEAFWRRLGFLVVQGYGLTETSPVVAVNHPFHARRGSVGKAIKGQELRIAGDGEILVRGASVVGETDSEGWFHTGDIGEIDANNHLYFKGRKKDLIVTPDGMNVHPEDVESCLNRIEGVEDAVVFAIADRIHASLILKADAPQAEQIIEEANRNLEPYQRIQGWSLWPEEDFPRTASTMKVRRADVANRTLTGLHPPASSRSQELPGDMTSLSSLERVDLLSELEQRLGIELDEEAFTRIEDRGGLEQLIEESRRSAHGKQRPPSVWAASRPVRFLRHVLQRGIVVPLFRHYLPLTISGLENLSGVVPPLIFAANHTSHLDTPAITSALPQDWRWRVAPAVRQEQFRAFFDARASRWVDVVQATVGYFLAGLFFNAYPLPQEMTGIRKALTTTGELARRGYCPLVFPEGMRTPDGQMRPFKPGIGLMALRLRLPVVPVFLGGLYDVYSVRDSWPRRGPVRVVFGSALRFPADSDYKDVAFQIETAIRELAKAGGGDYQPSRP